MRVFSLCLILLCFICPSLIAQSFVQITPLDALGLYYSDCSWIDFDNDRDLDFIIAGESATNELHTILYENLGNDVFRPASVPFHSLPQYSEVPICFANLNNDDRIDIILIGRRIGVMPNRTSALLNTTQGFQELNLAADFINDGGYSLVSMGDVNNDAQADLFVSGISGWDGANPILKAGVYIQNDNQYIKNTSSTLTGLYLGSSTLADFDKDGDLDLMITGSDNVYPYQVTELYDNDGLGNFTLDASQPLHHLQNSKIDVADFDNDNDLDILLSGFDPFLNSATKLYANNNGSFLQVNNTGLTGLSWGWGDFDNDGDLDVLGTGNGTFSIYRNQGNQTFHPLVNPLIENIRNGDAAWGDYDNDGDLDLLMTGNLGGGINTLRILRNETTLKNTRPTVPQHVTISTPIQNSIDIRWSPSSDNQSLQPSITYNLEVTRGCEKEYLLYSYSHPDGKRKVVEKGNVGLATNWSFNSLSDGMYHFRVQAIDGGYLASDFSEEQTVFIGAPSAPEDLTVSHECGKLKLNWLDNVINEEFFVIERSFNNGTFAVIDSVSFCITEYYDWSTQAGLYKYRVKSSNPNGASSYSDVFEIEILVDGVDIELGQDILLCEQSEYVLQAGAGFNSYQWNTGETSQEIVISETGLYWLNAFLGCIEVRDSITIVFEDPPLVDLGPDRPLCFDENIILHAGKNFTSYEWQDQSADSVFYVSQEGIYSVQITNVCGIASDTVVIKQGAVDKTNVVIPNVFTPNDDAFNQYFQIDDALTGSKLTIYDRWGKQLEEFNNYSNTWDGDDLPAGVYFYSIDSRDLCNQELAFKGWVSIIR